MSERQHNERDIERERTICDRLQSGETQTEIGKSLGITKERIRQIARRNGIPKTRAGGYAIHSPETVLTARAFWDVGYSIREIGKRMGVTLNVVAGLAHRNNFPPRPSPIRRAA